MSTEEQKPYIAIFWLFLGKCWKKQREFVSPLGKVKNKSRLYISGHPPPTFLALLGDIIRKISNKKLIKKMFNQDEGKKE